MKFPLIVMTLAALILSACTGRGFDSVSEINDAGSTEDGGFLDQSALESYAPDSPEYFSELIGNTVFFEVDQSAITEQTALVLQSQAEWLKQNPGFSVVLEGHADEQGTREYNLALGARRAESVKSYLVGLGIESSRLATITYGKERPVAVCSSESCWSQNRRSVTALQQDEA